MSQRCDSILTLCENGVIIATISKGGLHMTDVYKLPTSSYDELIKIIKAYGTGKVGVSVSLDDLVKSSGMSRTIISKNNGFLVQAGLITEGNKKSPTEICKKLANSYVMNLQDQTRVLWRELIDQDEFITSMISMVGIKNKISKTELINHIVYSANCGNGPGYKAGAAALVEIMKLINAINEIDGEIVIGDTMTQETESIDRESMLQSNNVVEQERTNTEIKSEVSFYIQQYTCESGQIAKIIIPDNATEDDLLGFRDMLNIALKRKFKLKLEE